MGEENPLMQKEKSAGVVAFSENGERRYLLLLYGEGHWDYIKGHIEENEGEFEAARREASEEASLTDLEFVEGFRKSINYFFRRRNMLISKEVVFLLAKTKNTNISLSYEHKDFLWLPYEEALKKLTFKNARDVLEEAESFLKEKHAQRRLENFGKTDTF